MDVFFISFKESNCEENWQQLLKLHVEAKRIHGIKGIDKAHLVCNDLSESDYFWTVDGDNWVTEPIVYNEHITHDLVMFKSFDPIQEDLTLLGGVKLWRKNSFVNKDMSLGDFSLNATKNKIVVNKSFSTTVYNSSPFDAWKTSFRHCVKLMSVIFKSRPNANNIDSYINQWKSCEFKTSLNADWAFKGYLDACLYVDKYDNNLDELYKINDYNWLTTFFRELYGTPKEG
jgi:hypothetical protein